MAVSVPTTAASSLTELELVALESGVNVADGHARQGPTASQQRIIDQLPELFATAARSSASILDEETQSAFLSALGQHTAVAATDAILSCYSSSVAMEIVGRALHAEGIRRVAVIHPTFDNIPDLLAGVGLSLVPIEEEELVDGPIGALPLGIDAVVATTPNNPTGRVISREQLAELAELCESRGLVLVLDMSFRGFDERSQYDHYATLAGSGCRYVVIEDTGKLWPTLDLKVAFLAVGCTASLPVRRIYTDLLLGVSPLILLLVRYLADDARAGGLAELRNFMAANRQTLRDELADVPSLTVADPDSRISVERIGVPAGRTGTEVWRTLRASGVHVLPCRQFHWARPAEGERFVRVALGRPPGTVARAASAIRERLAGW